MALMRHQKEWEDKWEDGTYKHIPCPKELEGKREIKIGENTCRVFFNWVPEGCYGLMPLNCFHAVGFITKNNEDYVWKEYLDDDIKNFDDACDIIRPLFEKAIQRLHERNNG